MRAVSDTDTVGAELRAARESRELSLEQVEKQTRIRIHYLAALEADEYAELPSAVQARGFLRNYARFLGLDADNLEARFNAALYNQARRGRHMPVFDEDPTPTLPSASRRTNPRVISQPAVRSTANHELTGGAYSRRSAGATTGAPAGRATSADERARARRSRTRNMTLGTLAIAAISIMAFALVLFYVMRNNASGLTPILSALPPTDTATPSPTETATSDIPTPLPNPNAISSGAAVGTMSSIGGVAIQITVHERAPLRITVDDQVVYSGVPVPNTVLKYQAKTAVQIHTGDAGGIDVVVNGVQQPPLGPAHAIADKTYTPAGLSTVSTANPGTEVSATAVNLTSISGSSPIPTGATVTPGFKP